METAKASRKNDGRSLGGFPLSWFLETEAKQSRVVRLVNGAHMPSLCPNSKDTGIPVFFSALFLCTTPGDTQGLPLGLHSYYTWQGSGMLVNESG